MICLEGKSVSFHKKETEKNELAADLDFIACVHCSPSGHICGDQDGGRPLFELSQDPVPLFLLFVTVDAHGGVAVASHQSGQIVGFPLRLNKDQDLVRGLTANLIQEP